MEAGNSELKSSRYFAILMDGSTDSSVTEKELVYVLFVQMVEPSVASFV